MRKTFFIWYNNATNKTCFGNTDVFKDLVLGYKVHEW